ncbi:hypothetical protein [Mesorhizobium sp.]|uniref:hypothetical protein n=1 Tax=Mesorhizobium sp. TaxID=1871066 RepID=UPI0011FFA14A|nr:hypothetical protein [Mesorhizobium sp.]TIP12693.1 MAG: hypothetical protein E5X73_10460 [Mesorhizobium sp.]
MPNGKPGDHPLTDIVTHRMRLIGGGVDEEIFNIVTEFGEKGVAKMEAFVTSEDFSNAAAVIQHQQKLLRDQLVDTWNQLILERRRDLPE